MDARGKAKAELLATLSAGRDTLYQQREKARRTCAESRALRHASPHDLMPLDLASRLIFRRVYEERIQIGVPSRMTAHLDGLAYTIAELAPIYVYEHGGQSVQQLSKEQLNGGLFQDGARTLFYLDGRQALTNLAMNVKDVQAVVETLVASQRGE